MRAMAPAVVLLACFVLAGCDGDEEALSASGNTMAVVITDAGTGCQYLSNDHGLTPRMNADARQICVATTPSKVEGAR